MISFLKIFLILKRIQKKITKIFSLYTSEGTQILTQLLFAPLMLYFGGLGILGFGFFNFNTKYFFNI